MGGDGGIGLFRPQDKVRPAVFMPKEDVDFGMGGKGISLNGLSCGDLQSSRPCISADEGVVEAALSREELSVVEAVFVLEAPLPLSRSQQLPHSVPQKLHKIQDCQVASLKRVLTDCCQCSRTYYRHPNAAMASFEVVQ